MGPKNYTSSLAIRTTCTTPKWVSKYDFIFANGYIFFSIITFIQGLPESTLKRYEFDRNGQKNDSTLRALGNPLASLKWVSKNYFVFSNPEFHFFQIAFIRGCSNLGLEWTEVEKKGAQELHAFARNRDHVYNSQMGIQIWFYICKWRILLFKNHLHSRLTRIDTKTIQIWSKRGKECLNLTTSPEPTCVSQMGNKKLFCIFKPIIPLLPNSLHSELVKRGKKNASTSRELGNPPISLKWVAENYFIFLNP